MATGLENLEIYKLAERLEIYIFKITATFPKNIFRIVNQLRASSSSVADNIAEAYGRYTYKDKSNKLYIARGEAEETKRGIIKSYKNKLLPKKIADFCDEKYTELIKKINGYIRYLRKKGEETKKKQINQLTNQQINKNGQILVELLVVIALAAVIFAVGGQLLDVTLKSNKQSKERLVAANLLQEGMEAAIAVSSEKWTTIYNLDKGAPNYYHPEVSAGKWVLVSGTENITLNGLTYTRSIVIENVNRNPSGNISGTGSNDPSTQKITINVNWIGGESLSISKYFSRWPNETAVQTNWSGGGGQLGPVTSFNNRYDTTDNNLDVTGTPGSIKLRRL